MKILFLSRWFPFPPDNGARIRIFHLIAGLAVKHQVDLIAFNEDQLSVEQMVDARRVCRNVETVNFRQFKPNGVKGMIGYFSPKPRFVVDTFNKDMQSAVKRAVTYNSYDIVIASQIDMAPYARGLPVPVKILEELELTQIYSNYANEERVYRKIRKGLTWLKLANYSAGLLRFFDGCTVVSDPEYRTLRKVVPRYEQLSVVPNGVDFDHYDQFCKPDSEEDRLIYSGALTYQANYEAVEYFLRSILPLILAQRPQVKLYVTGRTDRVPIDRLPNRNYVVFSGYVTDIRPWLSSSQVNVVPLLSGGGTRLKILEALAIGLPVVSTTKGAEGLGLVDGRDLIIANKPDEFAASVIRVISDPTLRQHLRDNGRESVRRQYDWKLITGKFSDFVESVPLHSSNGRAAINRV